MEEIAIIVIALFVAMGAFGTVVIFPIWVVLLLYNLKKSQQAIKLELEKLARTISSVSDGEKVPIAQSSKENLKTKQPITDPSFSQLVSLDLNTEESPLLFHINNKNYASAGNKNFASAIAHTDRRFPLEKGRAYLFAH